MIDDFNKQAFELVNLVEFRPKEAPKVREELKGSAKEKGFVDLSDKFIGDSTWRTTNYQGNTFDIFLENENGSFGFSETNYLTFRKLLESFHSMGNIYPLASFRFIEDEAIKWFVDVYKNQKASDNLYDYLNQSIDIKIKPIEFYFPVTNLGIEKPFKIGNVEFTYFKKEYFDELYNLYKLKDQNLTEEIFNNIYRNDFQGQVLAKVVIRAEFNRAEEKAKHDAIVAVNVLKLFSDSAVVPEKKTMFDLNFNLGYQVKSNFFTLDPNIKNSFSLSSKYNNRPFVFSDANYSLAFECGLKVFSDYILDIKSNELKEIIIQSIHLFGSAISNWDLHIRCVSMITILESIFLKEEELYKTGKKTMDRLTNTMTNVELEKERINQIYTHIYEIRHSMIHKALRLPISMDILTEAQKIMVNLFINLIRINTKFGFKDKISLIEELIKVKS